MQMENIISKTNKTNAIDLLENPRLLNEIQKDLDGNKKKLT